MENIYDSNKADVSHGSVMDNPRVTSLFTTQRGWRVLRLPGGRAGNKVQAVFVVLPISCYKFVPGWRGQTIRDSPFRQMVTARMWQQYINNMEPIDDALEIQAPYSAEEMLSLRMFCEEWNNDPGHIRFTRRLANHPSTSASDAILKETWCTTYVLGKFNLELQEATEEGNIPIRLAHDILNFYPTARV